jgi:hypothetical protein
MKAKSPDNRNSAVRTVHSADGRFTPDNSGRPRGARGKATQAVEALLDRERPRGTDPQSGGTGHGGRHGGPTPMP